MSSAISHLRAFVVGFRPRPHRCAILTALVAFAAGIPPAAAKDRRTLRTDAEVEAARRRLPSGTLDAWRRDLAWALAMSDEELWAFVPPPDQLRAVNVHFGADCPQHGKDIHLKAGHYPWIMTRELPFKVKCPVGGETYPTNDFVPWRHGGQDGKIDTSAPYVDDGRGWVAPDGKRYRFVAHYVFWRRWMTDILPVIGQLGQAHLLSGDPVYAHAAAVFLARIAADYPKMSYREQAYHGGEFPSSWPGGIADRIWETGIAAGFAAAYDAIFPALVGDTALAAFLRGKGIADAAAHIERNLLQEQARRILAGTIAGNMGMHQRAACFLAIVLDNDDPAKGATSRRLIDFVLEGPSDPNYVGTGGPRMGGVDEMLWSCVTRDGVPGESSPGYACNAASMFAEIAELLERRGIDLWAHPRMRKLADAWIDLTVAGEWTPDIGDSGSLMGSRRVGWDAGLYERTFRRWGDPRHARVLVALGARTGGLWQEPIDDAVREVAGAGGGEMLLPTRNLGGYGLAALEAGEGAARRGLALYYGHAGGGHGHNDRLNIQYWAYGRPMLPEMGYPAHWLDKNVFWTSNSLSHYTVTIDRRGQDTLDAGHLEGLAGMPGVQWVEASAEAAYPGRVSLYRRSTALIDLDAERSYLFDVFRVEGGAQHDWSFHGPAFGEFSMNGLSLSDVQRTGTLAGPDVPFGGAEPVRPYDRALGVHFDGVRNGPFGDPPASLGAAYGESASGFQYLFNVQRARAAGPWQAVWRVPPGAGGGAAADAAVGVVLHGWPSSASGETEVIAADAEPELQPAYPKTMKFLLQRRAGSGLASVFAGVVEPFKGEPVLASVTPVRWEEGGAEVVAARIGRPGGVDVVACGRSDASAARGKEIEFRGRFGRLSRRASEEPRGADLLGAALAGGGRIADDAFALEAEPWPEGRVAEVDLARNAIRVAGAPARLRPFVGRVLVIANEAHSTSYTVAAVDETAGWIGFGDVLLVIAKGRVAGVEGTTVKTRSRLTGYGRVLGGRFEGMRLASEDGSRSFRIVATGEDSIQLEGEAAAVTEAFKSHDGDGWAGYQVIDFGVGDAVRFPSFVGIAARGGGRYDVAATCTFRLTLPGKAGASFAAEGAGSEASKARVETAGGRTTVEVPAGALGDGRGVLRVE